MIHVRLAGGLGNQLFQIAAATLVDRSGQFLLIPYTDALGRYSESRKPDSLRLVNNSVFATHQDPTLMSRVWQWLIVTGRAGRWLPGLGLSDRAFQAGLQMKGHRRVAILDGYFQRGWNDDAMAQAIKRMQVRPPTLDATARVGAEECVIHIRGGDFLRLPGYRVAGSAYYGEAIRQARASGYTQFAVITDDRAFAIRACARLAADMPHDALRIVPPANDTLSDFDALRSATARILSNSTFSWWAAALDPQKARTWSPTQFTRAETRDYFLPWETPIKTENLSFDDTD